MITGVNPVRRRSPIDNRRGQSVIEFLLMLPMLTGLTLIMYKINTVMQMSIVNQQYARAQALWLAFNSPIFPEKRLQYKEASKGYNQMFVGVSGNVAPDPDEDEDPSYIPEAATFTINRKGQQQGSDENQSEPDTRTKIRIRTTVTLCSQSTWVGKDLAIFWDNQKMIPENVIKDSGYAYCASPKGTYVE